MRFIKLGGFNLDEKIMMIITYMEMGILQESWKNWNFLSKLSNYLGKIWYELWFFSDHAQFVE